MNSEIANPSLHHLGSVRFHPSISGPLSGRTRQLRLRRHTQSIYHAWLNLIELFILETRTQVQSTGPLLSHVAEEVPWFMRLITTEQRCASKAVLELSIIFTSHLILVADQMEDNHS